MTTPRLNLISNKTNELEKEFDEIHQFILKAKIEFDTAYSDFENLLKFFKKKTESAFSLEINTSILTLAQKFKEELEVWEKEKEKWKILFEEIEDFYQIFDITFTKCALLFQLLDSNTKFSEHLSIKKQRLKISSYEADICEKMNRINREFKTLHPEIKNHFKAKKYEILMYLIQKSEKIHAVQTALMNPERKNQTADVFFENKILPFIKQTSKKSRPSYFTWFKNNEEHLFWLGILYFHQQSTNTFFTRLPGVIFENAKEFFIASGKRYQNQLQAPARRASFKK